MADNEKVLFENKWIQVYEKDNWYTCSRSPIGDGVLVLPYRLAFRQDEVLIRLEHTPCHEDGPRLDEKYNWTSLTGMIEGGLTARETAVKELYEESGYQVDGEKFQYLGWVYPTKQTSDKVHLFGVDLSGLPSPMGKLKGDGTKGEEGASTLWVPVKKAAQLHSAVMSTAILKLQMEKVFFL